MARLTGTERAIAEIAAVGEHIASLTAAAMALQLSPDVPNPSRDGATPLVPLLDTSNAGEAAAGTLAEIGVWGRQVLGIEHVPAIWRALAHRPRLLEATWRKDRLVMSAGTLDELAKGCAALAVAQFRQNAYWTGYLTHYLRKRFGLSDDGVVELAGAVMHFVSFNTIAHGMRLEAPFSEMTAADVAPGGRFERFLPGPRSAADGTGQTGPGR